MNPAATAVILGHQKYDEFFRGRDNIGPHILGLGRLQGGRLDGARDLRLRRLGRLATRRLLTASKRHDVLG
jgi:hypothetical protein